MFCYTRECVFMTKIIPWCQVLFNELLQLFCPEPHKAFHSISVRLLLLFHSAECRSVEEYDKDCRLTLMFCLRSERHRRSKKKNNSQYLECKPWVDTFLNLMRTDYKLSLTFEHILYCSSKIKSFSIICQISFD